MREGVAGVQERENRKQKTGNRIPRVSAEWREVKKDRSEA
jgi:hypothetical protein